MRMWISVKVKSNNLQVSSTCCLLLLCCGVLQAVKSSQEHAGIWGTLQTCLCSSWHLTPPTGCAAPARPGGGVCCSEWSASCHSGTCCWCYREEGALVSRLSRLTHTQITLRWIWVRLVDITSPPEFTQTERSVNDWGSAGDLLTEEAFSPRGSETDWSQTHSKPARGWRGCFYSVFFTSTESL